jgi:hypothetical protein
MIFEMLSSVNNAKNMCDKERTKYFIVIFLPFVVVAVVQKKALEKEILFPSKIF